MIEFDRLVEGRFSADFLVEEVRCDFRVTEERKKIWVVELDLLLKFDEVCRRHGLRYWLAFGSLLGAVRHKGYIPWDDDLDVVMLREDYDKLLLLSAEFQEPHFLQIPGQDNGYYYSFIKIRNSNTTGLSKMFRYERFNQGLFIDVFPLDNYMPGESSERFDRIQKLCMDLSTCMRMRNPELNEANRRRVAEYSGGNPKDILKEIDTLAKVHNGHQTDFVTTATMSIYPRHKMVWPRSAFEGSVKLPVEGFLFDAPVDARRVLEITYGDFMQLPPVEKRGTWHAGCIFDPDTPYTKYLGTCR